MNNFILSIANWLVAQHSITLSGWGWILMIPIAIIFLALVAWIGGYIVLGCIIGGMWR